MFGLGMQEILLLLLLGVLLFGRKLPDIGRSLGKTVIEFKKGFAGMEDEINSAASTRTRRSWTTGRGKWRCSCGSPTAAAFPRPRGR